MTSARVFEIALVAALAGCGDRAPPALWPEPPPPTLAEPIGAQPAGRAPTNPPERAATGGTDAGPPETDAPKTDVGDGAATPPTR